MDANNDERSINALLVDDQQLVRSGLSMILCKMHGITVVGECSDGDEVEGAVARVDPDIVVMDLRMKRMDGIEATKRLVERNGPPVLILTTFSDDELLSGALRAGAAGFVLKESPAEELIRAVRAVGGGHGYLDPAVTSRVLTTYRRAIPLQANVADLTTRERDVMVWIAKGCTNSEIAHTLCISEPTVKSHIGHIFTKLGLRNRSAAIVFAYEQGIVNPV
ncbi:DNA-binding NarL/FixJ family response regulator [Mycobacterium sp. MAA66]|uniref:response regulator transcription factor n=1 Tax=Mycobacterium sp. MAA66 TaxID=3156297 RepID=UPI003515D875